MQETLEAAPCPYRGKTLVSLLKFTAPNSTPLEKSEPLSTEP